jgi:glycerol-3-phosphate acyltransferase PlsY
MERLICLAAGYVCGCLLTAEVVARWKTGRGARTLGSGNPGMANIAGALGKGAGALVLAGDLLKTAWPAPCAVCCWLLIWAAWPSYTPDWARPWAIISPSGAASTAAKG